MLQSIIEMPVVLMFFFATVIRDAEDPRFDLEKYLVKVAEENP